MARKGTQSLLQMIVNTKTLVKYTNTACGSIMITVITGKFVNLLVHKHSHTVSGSLNQRTLDISCRGIKMWTVHLRAESALPTVAAFQLTATKHDNKVTRGTSAGRHGMQPTFTSNQSHKYISRQRRETPALKGLALKSMRMYDRKFRRLACSRTLAPLPARKHLPRGLVIVFAVPTLMPLVNSSVRTDVGMKYGCTTAFFVELGALLLEELCRATISCGACSKLGTSKACADGGVIQNAGCEITVGAGSVRLAATSSGNPQAAAKWNRCFASGVHGIAHTFCAAI